jgi:hypothetical protein
VCAAQIGEQAFFDLATGDAALSGDFAKHGFSVETRSRLEGGSRGARAREDLAAKRQSVLFVRRIERATILDELRQAVAKPVLEWSHLGRRKDGGQIVTPAADRRFRSADERPGDVEAARARRIVER